MLKPIAFPVKGKKFKFLQNLYNKFKEFVVSVIQIQVVD